MRRLGLWGSLWWQFRREAKMVWAMLRNPATPPAAKAVAILGLIYLVSPVDLISDFIPILGWLDDGIVLMLLLKLAYRLLPPELYVQLRERAARRSR
jgi:uncharacterized membrane protein YkvA (DUF1232 family)